jgi:sarcosine oxidase
LPTVKDHDVIVLGLGAFGSSVLYQLARRGCRALGIDQFSPPHPQGSTHGDTRITRLAIGEGDEYVPFALRSHEIWREIEREAGKKLLFRTGGLIISSAARTTSVHVENFFRNTLAAAEKYGIGHEILPAADIRKRFPQFNVADDEIGYFEPEAGYLLPEECVRVQIGLAGKHGAAVHINEKVLSFSSDGSKVHVKTDRDAYTANELVVTAGPWLPGLVGREYSDFFKIYRQVLFWFDIEENSREIFAPDRCPVFIWELQGKTQGIYGFPAAGGPEGGIKIATEQFEKTTTPETVDRTVTISEIGEMYETHVAPYFPELTGRCLKAVTCLYTTMPGARFLIDRHPEHENVTIVSPCSGHGFKHSASIGEAIAENLLDGKSRLDLGKFSFDWFQ